MLSKKLPKYFNGMANSTSLLPDLLASQLGLAGLAPPATGGLFVELKLYVLRIIFFIFKSY